MEYSKKTVQKLFAEKDKEATEKALKELGETLEVFSGYITEEAIEIAHEDGRNVVKKEDIQKALE